MNSPESNVPSPKSWEHFIHNATTPEQHASNVRFQLDNVDGFLLMAAEEKFGGREAAAAKARCLLDSANLLLARLEAELREMRNQAAREDAHPTEVTRYPEHKPNAEVMA